MTINETTESENARRLIQDLLTGKPVNGILPSDCGPWSEVALSLAEAAQAGGVEAVKKAFAALVRTWPDLTHLVAADPRQPRVNSEPARAAKDKQLGERILSPVLVCMGDIEPEKVEWLWHPYIPGGKLTLLEGDPGVGKTWLSLQLAAIISRGDPFLGQDGTPGGHREPGNVLYLSAEDGLADTLRPRLDVAGADVRRVVALSGWTSIDPESGKEITGAVTLQHLQVIEEALKQVSPKLLVILR